jgi:hypothetical protein
MTRANFANLRIYQLSDKLADQVWHCVSHWNTFAQDTIGKQLVRAADSIGANIAEGSGREVLRNFGDSSECREDLCSRHCIGSGELTRASWGRLPQ